MIKTYTFVSNYEQLFRCGVDNMVEVDRFDYGLPWDTLKNDEEGDTVMFEITDYEILSPDEKLKWVDELEKRMWKKKKLKEAKIKMSKIKNRVKRLILQEDYRRFYWAPGYILGRLALTLSYIGLANNLHTLDARVGLFTVAHAISYCARFLAID